MFESDRLSVRSRNILEEDAVSRSSAERVRLSVDYTYLSSRNPSMCSVNSEEVAGSAEDSTLLNKLFSVPSSNDSSRPGSLHHVGQQLISSYFELWMFFFFQCWVFVFYWINRLSKFRKIDPWKVLVIDSVSSAIPLEYVWFDQSWCCAVEYCITAVHGSRGPLNNSRALKKIVG